MVLSAEELDPANIVEAGTVAWEELTLEPPGEDDDGDEGDDDESGDATVQVREHDELGDILVNSSGMTLYLFVPDDDAEGSSCQGSCAATWPPLTIDGEPAASDEVTAEVNTFVRDDTGEMQVTANGWPLYFFTEDDQPGDANGQGAQDVWWTVNPDGTATRSPE